MSFLFPRNILGFTTMEDLLLNSLQIQTQAVGGFSIYISDPNNPIFTVDGTTGTITTRGTLNVLGTASFQTITITDTTESLFSMASENQFDNIDIGFFGQYNKGTGELFGSVYRNASDPARRWFFVNDFKCTPPISTIPGITTANFAGVVANLFNTNDGNPSLVSYGFYSDIDTGMYLYSNNNLGFSAGGINILRLTNTGTDLEAKFNNSVKLYYTFLGTLNDINSSLIGVTTGSLTLQASNLSDKWNRYISTNPISGYAGSIFSFGLNSHYFMTNKNGSLTISNSTQNLGSITDPPDYRDSSIYDILNINSTRILSNIPVISSSFRYNIGNNYDAIINLSSDTNSHYITVYNNSPTITLPNGSSETGREFVFIWRGIPGVLTIQTTGGSTIGNNASPFTYNATTYTIFKLVYDYFSNDWLFM